MEPNRFIQIALDQGRPHSLFGTKDGRGEYRPCGTDQKSCQISRLRHSRRVVLQCSLADVIAPEVNAVYVSVRTVPGQSRFEVDRQDVLSGGGIFDIQYMVCRCSVICRDCCERPVNIRQILSY
jgi:hypothetical protein